MTLAGGLYWMFRYLERSENTTRLLDAGFRMSLTRSTSTQNEWRSVLETTGATYAFSERHEEADLLKVVDFLLRDRSNQSVSSPSWKPRGRMRECRGPP